MPPKKTGTAAKKASTATHGSYHDMIKEAILQLKERSGSSRQAIKKYIKANNKLGDVSDAAFNSHINRALQTGEKNGEFLRPKGASGPVKLAKKESKPAPAKKEPKPAAKPAAKASTTKKSTTATTTKTTATKKAAAPKKTTKAAAPKKAAAKPKANASKPRKTAAPAVIDTKPTLLGKTKSGRVTKTTKAPAAKPKKAATTKKAAPKKAAAKKAEAAA